MAPDIRSFFTPGGAGSKKDKAPPKPANKAAESGAKKRQKSRKVVSDSEEDNIAPAQPTPKKVNPPIRAPKATKDEEVDASSYFASSNKGKAQPSGQTPTKSKAKSAIAPKPSTPVKNTATLPERSSTRKRKPVSYTEPSTVLQQVDGSGDDIMQNEYKTGRQMEDGYEESSSEGTFNMTPKDSGKRSKRDSINDEVDEDEDVKPTKRRKVHANSAANEKPKKAKANSRKRKSPTVSASEAELSEEKTKKKPRKKATPAKKLTAKQERDEKVENAAIQSIYDSVPTVRPPTPPPKDNSTGWKFQPGAHANSGPVAAASLVDIPVGAENCLTGLSFVFTGLGEVLDRDTGTNLVKQYGGRILTSVSTKTNYVILGSNAGPKKLETIQKLGIKTISEEGLFHLIKNLPANGGNSKAAAEYEATQVKEDKKIKDLAIQMEKDEKKKSKPPQGRSGAPPVEGRLWTVKYAPNALPQICGNKGAVEKLSKWLKHFDTNLHKGFRHLGADGSGQYRACIIHGPAGIGKTTAAHVVANLEGYDVIETNASDSRSKKLVENGLKDVLDNTSILGFYAGHQKDVEAKKKKIVLIMDEVDGMSAGDRGGVGALAQICRKTSVPMILICNERRLPKMKPFDRVTYDLAFKRPSVQEVRSRIMTICHREEMKMPAPVINALIEGCHGDIRQIINLLSTIKLDQSTPDFDDSKKMSKAWQKHAILKPWDIAQKILSGHMFSSSSSSTLNDKAELYFNDHSFSFLMLQENYLNTTPLAATKYVGREKNLKHLELVDKAAQSISDGDLVDRMIHGPQQHWTLMSFHAVASFVQPASFAAGPWVPGRGGGYGASFTTWLGQNSKQMKLARYVKEIQGHMRLRASGDRHEVRQQYLPVLWHMLIKRLQAEGKDSVQDVIDLMDSYFLTREDWDAIMELGVGKMDENVVDIATATKSTFTRLYNTQNHPMPFIKASTIGAPAKAVKSKPDLEEAIEESEAEEEAPEDNAAVEAEGDISKDKYIKQPKKKAAPKAKGKKGAKKNDDTLDDGESEEEVKPKKAAKGRAKKGKGKK
ncbi:MAG: hypothetical protein M1814_005005 [Vezdaea aestivalis]|nr:MAG: hypothetical protein M1814_005005 [Vezdaea aestivalis]